MILLLVSKCQVLGYVLFCASYKVFGFSDFQIRLELYCVEHLSSQLLWYWVLLKLQSQSSWQQIKYTEKHLLWNWMNVTMKGKAEWKRPSDVQMACDIKRMMILAKIAELNLHLQATVLNIRVWRGLCLEKIYGKVAILKLLSTEVNGKSV